MVSFLFCKITKDFKKIKLVQMATLSKLGEELMGNILVTGAIGQIGSELVRALRDRHENKNIIASDIRNNHILDDNQFEILDVLDKESLEKIVRKHDIDTIYHLAALLSAVGEQKPLLAWDINVNGAMNILEVAQRCGVKKVFIPSSIAAFGPSTPHDKTPQDTVQRPNAIYGITKVAIEFMGEYFYERFGVDCRGVRLPGIISYQTPPGGGTTDYAVAMLVSALRGETYSCYLSPNTSLDMMYMSDALQACIGIIEADGEKLQHRNAFNVTSFPLTPARLAEEIQKHIPNFKVTYSPDPVRQAIADSWPNSLDDSAARKEWGWEPKVNLSAMVEEMLTQLPAYIDKFPQN